MERFDSIVKNILSPIDNNEYLSAALPLFLVLYAGLAAPKLPEYIARLFDNPLFKLLIFFLIAYSSKKNPTVAIIAAVGLMVSLHTLQRYDINRRMVSLVQEEEQAAAMEAQKHAEEALQDQNSEIDYTRATVELAEAVAQLRTLQAIRRKAGK